MSPLPCRLLKCCALWAAALLLTQAASALGRSEAQPARAGSVLASEMDTNCSPG